METKGIESMLTQLQAASNLAASKPAGHATESGGTDFAQALKSAIDQVNQNQQRAQAMAQDFASGDNNTNLHEVMLSLQKANVSFQEMIQVRNKLVSAYQDVMNMQV